MKENPEKASRRLPRAANKQGSEGVKKEPIADFMVCDNLYLVFPESRLNCQIGEVVGKFEEDLQKYLIVRSEKAPRADPSFPLRNSVDILTKRELQIVMLVAEGRVDKQIADQLKISRWTVSTHLRRIFAKLGVDSRAAMVYQCLNRMGRIQSIMPFKS